MTPLCTFYHFFFLSAELIASESGNLTLLDEIHLFVRLRLYAGKEVMPRRV